MQFTEETDTSHIEKESEDTPQEAYGVTYADFNNVYEDPICAKAKTMVSEKLMRLASLESAILSPAFTMLPSDKRNDMMSQWYREALSLKNGFDAVEH